jgi:hypothetical protein
MAMMIMLKKRKRKESVGPGQCCPSVRACDPLESRKQWKDIDILKMNFSVGVNM